MEEKDIKMIVDRTTENVFETLRKNGFEIKEKKTTFQRTEQLLYLMPQLKEAINHNKNNINDLNEFGIDKKGGAVHVVPTVTPIRQDEEELIQKEVNKLKQRNHILNAQIKWINNILQTISTDKFYDIIDLKYYKGKTLEQISEQLLCDVSTIGRNRTRIINLLKVKFFPNDAINELGC